MIQIVSAKGDVNHWLSKDELLFFSFLQYLLLSFTVKNRILGKINFDLTLDVELMFLCFRSLSSSEKMSAKREESYIPENKLDHDYPSRDSAPQNEYSTLPF